MSAAAPPHSMPAGAEELCEAVNTWLEVLTEAWTSIQANYYGDTSQFEERLTAARMRVAEAGWREAARRAETQS